MDNSYIDIPSAISQCADDLAGLQVITLEAQVRAYRLLDSLLADEAQSYKASPEFAKAAEEFINAINTHHPEYDEDALKKELSSILAPIDAQANDARFRAASAESLHEFAKEVWNIWQTSGVFARRRAIKELRQRAGFRLETHRIGNYVAKTYDLMNEAHAQYAKAQQARFAADVSYMIQPGIYDKIKEQLN
ncbi:MAG: hypothetical protein IKY48_02705 [Bacteroidales bacterium]|nr:hypothetical protein [Bacteroidales bacterium]